jgi:Flp pilus assembly protein TadG
MMMQKLKSFLKCERGTQMIEFALVFPVLLLLFAGAVEFGRMFYTYTTLQKSTEAGARYLSKVTVSGGTFSSTDTTTATNLIVCGKVVCSGQSSIAPNLTAANVTITPPGTAIGTRYVTVQVTYSYQPMVFNLAGMTGASGLSLNFTFTPAIKMRYML